MIKTTTFEEIGCGKYAAASISIKTDYEQEMTYVSVDGDLKSSHASTVAAIEAAFDEPTAEYILDRL